MNGLHLLDDTPEDFEENEKEEELLANKGFEALNEITEEQENPLFKFDVIEATAIKEENVESDVNLPLQ